MGAPDTRGGVCPTRVGRAAFDQHVVALQEIVGRAGLSVFP
jgi:hypothetical protein